LAFLEFPEASGILEVRVRLGSPHWFVFFAEEHGMDLLEVDPERHRDMDLVFAGLDLGLILWPGIRG
jgi:hypothetical protein